MTFSQCKTWSLEIIYSIVYDVDDHINIYGKLPMFDLDISSTLHSPISFTVPNRFVILGCLQYVCRIYYYVSAASNHVTVGWIL